MRFFSTFWNVNRIRQTQHVSIKIHRKQKTKHASSAHSTILICRLSGMLSWNDEFVGLLVHLTDHVCCGWRQRERNDKGKFERMKIQPPKKFQTTQIGPKQGRELGSQMPTLLPSVDLVSGSPGALQLCRRIAIKKTKRRKTKKREKAATSNSFDNKANFWQGLVNIYLCKSVSIFEKTVIDL